MESIASSDTSWSTNSGIPSSSSYCSTSEEEDELRYRCCQTLKPIGTPQTPNNSSCSLSCPPSSPHHVDVSITAMSSSTSPPIGCNYCKMNHFPVNTWKGHDLFDPVTKLVACPVLRRSKCPLCGATGGLAHQAKDCWKAHASVPGADRINIGCGFCKRNGEIKAIWRGHALHDPITKKVMCPVLRRNICPLCGVTGDMAHTVKYCWKSHMP